ISKRNTELAAAQVLSGTSITSPSRSQKSGAGLESEQSRIHSRFFPVFGSWRVAFTCERSEEVNRTFEFRSAGLIQNGTCVVKVIPDIPCPGMAGPKVISGARRTFVVRPFRTTSTVRERHFCKFTHW